MPISTLSIAKIRLDGGTQSRSAIYQNTVDDYAAAMSDGAEFPPILVFYDGDVYWLADGFHRHAAYRKAGIEAGPVEIRQGTRRDAILYSVGANETHGLRRTNEDKRRAVMTLLNDEEWSKWSDREVARRCAVSNDFVSRLRRSLSSDDSDERTYTTKSGTVSTMNTANIGKSPTVVPFDPVQQREIIEQAKSIVQSDSEARHDLLRLVSDVKNVRGTQGTGDNEWYTPEEYLEAARSVLGEFDLDPASNAEAQKYVKATKFFSKEDDGLKQEWNGRIWLNPPYAQPFIFDFVQKMVSEIDAGNVSEAIMLTHNYTDTEWFHAAVMACSAICFTHGRIKFWKSNGCPPGSPTQGQAFFYFGSDPERFRQVFSKIGFLVTPSSDTAEYAEFKAAA